MILNIVLLLVGFVALIKGADIFVGGSSSVARLLKVPSVVIGLTIVAMGTSAPEAAVSLTAAISGSNDIALGNVIGSNLFNLLMVIGVCALIHPIPSHKDIIRRDSWWNMGTTVLLFLFMQSGMIDRWNGLVLVGLMLVYLVTVVRSALRNRVEAEDDELLTPLRSVIYIAIGLAAVILGGRLVVNNASAIAAALGMSQTLISLTIIAIGTSLPELVTSVVASRRGDNGLALGNVIGSNLFNIMFILGASTAIIPIHVAAELYADTLFLIAVTALILLMTNTGKKTARWEGLICVLLYAGYTAHIILR